MDWFIDDTTTDAATQERTIVPEGRHTFTIAEAEEGVDRDGKPRLSIRLSAVEGRYSFVFVDVYADAVQLARSLAAAVGVSAAGPALTLTPADIRGRRVDAVIFHNKAGKPKARTFHAADGEPATAAPPTAPPASTSRRTKGPAAPAGADDIPF